MSHTEQLHSEITELKQTIRHQKDIIDEVEQKLKEENKKLKEQLDEQYEFSHYKQAKEYEKLKADITLHPDFKALVEFAMAEPERQRVAHQEAGTALDYIASSSSVVLSSSNKFSNK